MKQLLASALVSLVAGICFALGVAGVILIAGNWGQFGGPLAEEHEFISLPPNVRIVAHAHIPGTPMYTVRGVIENTGVNEWVGVSIEAAIKAGGAQVNTCDTRIDGKFPGRSRRAFQIECYGVAGNNTPDNLSYELSVRSAVKHPTRFIPMFTA